LSRTAVVAAAVLCTALSVLSQEDLSRPDGLPSRIGGPSCSNSNGRPVASITGFLYVNGVSNTNTPPTYSVAVYAGGTFFARRRLKNGGSFAFYCVPRESVSLVGEVDSNEVTTVPMGILSGPPAINRQDVNISWSDLSGSKQRTGVVSARNAYGRSKENEKRFEKALDHIRNGKTSEAIEILKHLLEEDPKDWAAWTVLGNLEFNAGMWDAAATAYSDAIRLKGDYVPALIGFARSQINTKQFERAIELLLKAQTVESSSPDVDHYLGEAYLQLKKGTLAIEHFRKAIEAAPNEKADLHLRIAALYNAAGAKDLAAKEYETFLQKRPEYPQRQQMEKYISENRLK
jgi:Flp pilus assembly protein TadD